MAYLGELERLGHTTVGEIESWALPELQGWAPAVPDYEPRFRMDLDLGEEDDQLQVMGSDLKYQLLQIPEDAAPESDMDEDLEEKETVMCAMHEGHHHHGPTPGEIWVVLYTRRAMARWLADRSSRTPVEDSRASVPAGHSDEDGDKQSSSWVSQIWQGSASTESEASLVAVGLRQLRLEEDKDPDVECLGADADDVHVYHCA